MSTRSSLVGAAAVLALIAGVLGVDRGATAQSFRGPNILIVVTDDQRHSSDGLSVMPETIRLFRSGGTFFPNAVATTPLCCPSRATLMTGRYAHNTNVTTLKDAKDLDQRTTMQYQLRSRGYKTAHIGKYMNNWSGSKPHFDLVGGRSGYYTSNGSYGTTVNQNAAISFLNKLEQSDATPWLMYVNIYAPHAPATPEARYQNAPVPSLERVPSMSESDRSDKPPYVRAQSKGVPTGFRARQLRTLMSADDAVEAIFERLEALGETSDTLAFFLSDNGYMWGEHKLDKKRHAYNESVRIPLFVRWPGRVAAGARDTDVVGTIDVAPTVYDAVGVTPDDYRPDGRSLFGSNRSHMLTEYGGGDGAPRWAALWSPQWTYVEYGDGFREYYGRDDPWQLDNVFHNGVAGDEPDAARLHDLLGAATSCAGRGCP